jgi:hypothetical protein
VRREDKSKEGGQRANGKTVGATERERSGQCGRATHAFRWHLHRSSVKLIPPEKLCNSSSRASVKYCWYVDCLQSPSGGPRICRKN